MHFKKVVKKLKDFNPNNFQILSCRSGIPFAEMVISHLKAQYSSNIQLGKLPIENFPGGEIKERCDENLREQTVHLFQCFAQRNDKDLNNDLIELLITLDQLKRSGATKIIVYLPYLPYQRQDKKTEGREPLSAKWIFDVISASAGKSISRIVTSDMHSAAAAGYADFPVDNLTAWTLFSLYIKQILKLNPDDYAIVSPDAGGAARARAFAEAMGARVAIIEKKRERDGNTKVNYLIGEEEVDGKIAIIIDDMIATGGSSVEGQRLLTRKGAIDVYAFATHGLFNVKFDESEELDMPAELRLYKADIKVVVTDTIPEKHAGYFISCKKWLMGVLSMTRYYANTLYCNETAGSVSETMKNYQQLASSNDNNIDINTFLLINN